MAGSMTNCGAHVHLPAAARWREWMGRVEAVIFASPKPVPREILARVVGRECNLDRLLADIREELRGHPYELVAVAGGFQHRTRRSFGDVIRSTGVSGVGVRGLSQHEAVVLSAIAYFQPATRRELSEFFGREISRDTIASLRVEGLIAAGPRSPQPGAPYTYVTTPIFLLKYGFESLRDLPDLEQLEEAGLLSKAMPLDTLSGPQSLIGDVWQEEAEFELDAHDG
jgi:segregation and condensation protein B